MKGVDIFCASEGATSICRSMEQISSSSYSSPSSSTTTLLLRGGGGGRVIDRHNPIIKDSKRATSKPTPPPTSKLHPRNNNINSRNATIPNSSHLQHENHPNKSDLSLSSDDDKAAHYTSTDVSAAISKRKSWSCKPGDFLSPPGSTRYLLREKVYYNTDTLVSDSHPTNLQTSNKDINTHDSSPSDLPQQVVVMRVSLHCRGCEKKLRKHLSRMEGVKSFEIDYPARKVTVTGNVMASDVVSSISKVMKNAQLWSTPISSSNPIKTDDFDNYNNVT